MNYHRRDFITLVGGGVVVAATASCAALADDARTAWRSPGAGETDPRRWALSWAILAPNPHNMQPWLADLSEPDVITLYIDRTRLLPVTDPFNRQIVIGCGAFLELLRMAAMHKGFSAAIDPFPEGEPHPLIDDRPVARVRFSGGGRADPLFAHVLARRTNRNPFSKRPVSEGAARAVAVAGEVHLVTSGFTVEPDRVAALKALAFEAARIEAHTPAAHRESVDRFFIGSEEVERHRYGIAVEGQAINAFHAVGLLTRKKMKQPGTFAFDQAMNFLKKGAETSRAFTWLVTKGESRAEELAAGAAYLRTNLAATAQGLGMQPWSQGLQEYATQKAMFAALHRELAPDGGRVQIFARIGYGGTVPPAPRRGLEPILRSA